MTWIADVLKVVWMNEWMNEWTLWMNDWVIISQMKYIVGSKPTGWLHFMVDTSMSRNGKAVVIAKANWSD